MNIKESNDFNLPGLFTLAPSTAPSLTGSREVDKEFYGNLGSYLKIEGYNRIYGHLILPKHEIFINDRIVSLLINKLENLEKDFHYNNLVFYFKGIENLENWQIKLNKFYNNILHPTKSKSENVNTKELIKTINMIINVPFKYHYEQLYQITNNMNILFYYLLVNQMKEEQFLFVAFTRILEIFLDLEDQEYFNDSASKNNEIILKFDFGDFILNSSQLYTLREIVKFKENLSGDIMLYYLKTILR